MTPAYVQTVGRLAYIWGWPLVYVDNHLNELTKVPEPLLLDNDVCVAPMNQLAMLTNYANLGFHAYDASHRQAHSTLRGVIDHLDS